MEKVESVAEFLARSGKIQVIPEGEKTQLEKVYHNCRCGCEGNYTDHQMRKGERGSY
jgi:hypothetical protein